MLVLPNGIGAQTQAPPPPIFTCPSNDDTWYVSPNGTGNNCTANDECGVVAGVNKAQPGDTVIFRDGTYDTGIDTVRSGNAGNCITFRAENQWQAYFIVDDTTPIEIEGHDYIVFDGFRVTDVPKQSREFEGAFQFDRQGGADFIIIENNWTFNTGSMGINQTGINQADTNIIIRNNLIDGCGFNDDELPDPSDNVDGECIYMGAAASSGGQGADNVMIYGNEIRRWTSNAIDLKPNVQDSWIWDNNIHDMASPAEHGPSTIVTGGTMHIIGGPHYVYNNRIWDTIDNNRIFRIRAPNNADHLIYNNLIYDSGNGLNEIFESDSGNGSAEIFNNTIWNLDPADPGNDPTGFQTTYANNIGIPGNGGIDIDNVNANWFVNPGAGDFNLTANATAAIDGADQDPFSPTDFDGIAINGAERDVGAHEFIQSITMANLQQAIDNANPGDIITVQDGTSNDISILIDHNDNCTQAQPCTIKAQTSRGITLTGNGSGFHIQGNHWIIEDMVFSGQTNSPLPDNALLQIQSAQNIIIRNWQFTGLGGTLNQAIWMDNDPDVEQCREITIEDSEFDNWTSIDDWIWDIKIQDKNTHNCQQIVFRNNHFHDLDFDAASEFGGNTIGNNPELADYDCDVLFENNIFENIQKNAEQDSGAFHPKCSNVRLVGNIFRNNEINSVRFRQGIGNILDRNIFENNDASFGTADVTMPAGGEHVIINNQFRAKNGTQSAISFSRGCTLYSPGGNYCDEPDPANDCHYMASSDTIVAHNTFISYDVDAIDMDQNESSSQCGPVNVCAEDNFIHNNVFYQDNGGKAIRVDNGCNQQTVTHNLFFFQGGASTDITGTNEVNGDPLLTNIPGDDLTLLSNSPAIDAGQNVANTTLDNFDFAGISRPQNVAHDIGAHEFVGVSGNPVYYVVQATGVDSDCTQIQNQGTPALTIAFARACADADTSLAGNSVLVGDGVYNEQVQLFFDAEQTNRFLLSNISGTSPIIDGTGVGIANGSALVDFGDADWVTISNFTIRDADVEKCFRVGNGHGVIVENNIIDNCAEQGIAFVFATGQSFSTIRGNTISNTGEGGISIFQNTDGYFLIENNTISDNAGTNGFAGIYVQDTPFIVIRNNTIHSQGAAANYLHIGGSTPGSTNHTVIEKNDIYRGTGSEVSVVELTNQPTRVIVRENTFRHIGMLFSQPAPTTDLTVKIYNNTVNEVGVDTSTANIAVGFLNNSGGSTTFTGIELKNNAIIGSFGNLLNHGPNALDGTDSAIRMDTNAYRYGPGGGIIWNGTGGQQTFSGDQTGHDAWKAAFGQEDLDLDVLTTQTNAQLFVDATNRNFMPVAGSDLIDAGRQLTFATSNGTGTSIPVDNSAYFFDGYQMVTGDLVVIGNNLPVTITAINEASDILMVNTAITWSVNDPVYRPFNGLAPDIGAVEFGDDTTPPTAPPNFTASPLSISSIFLQWDPATDDVGLLQYRLEQCIGAGCVNFVEIAILPLTPTNATIGGLLPETIYRYRLRAEDTSNNLGAYSQVGEAITQVGGASISGGTISGGTR